MLPNIFSFFSILTETDTSTVDENFVFIQSCENFKLEFIISFSYNGGLFNITQSPTKGHLD